MNLLARLIGLADRDHWDEIAELRDRAVVDAQEIARLTGELADALTRIPAKIPTRLDPDKFDGKHDVQFIDREAVAAGMTERESEVWATVGVAAGMYLRLTEDEPQHPMEREEICHAFHVIQGWLAGRPFIRAMGIEKS